MKRLYYILIMITVGMLASCSLSFDSFIDEEDADLANNGDGFTAPRHIKNETGTATYQFHENVVWLNHDDYNGYIIEIKDSLISFASSMPAELLPNPGDVVYHAADDRFGGISIEAERVFKDGDRFKCIGNNVDGTRVFKVLKIDMKSNYQENDDTPSDITRATDMKKTFRDTTYTKESKITQTSTVGHFSPVKYTGIFEWERKWSQRLKQTFDIHFDSDKDEFRLGLDSYVKTTFTQTVSANGTVEIRWVGPFSVESPSMIPVPTIPIPIIPKIVSVELAYQYETKDGYANYKETSTDTNESWYGFEIGVEPGSIKPYFKERDNRTKTTSKYETSGYKNLDESRHTFSVKVVGLSIPGFSVFEKGVGISYINRKDYTNNLTCYLRDQSPYDKISLPLPFYEYVKGNNRTEYTHALDIFLAQNKGGITTTLDYLGINQHVPTIVKLLPFGTMFGDAHFKEITLSQKNDYQIPVIKNFSLGAFTADSPDKTRLKGYVEFDKVGRTEENQNEFTDLSLLIWENSNLERIIALDTKGAKLQKNKKYEIDATIDNLNDEKEWNAAIVATEPNEKRIYMLEELRIYKPEECSRFTKVEQAIGREDYDGNYLYAVSGIWEHIGREYFHVGGVRLKLYDESKSLVAVKYFRFDEKNHAFNNRFGIIFTANRPEKFTAELATGVYKSKTSTNADFDKTVKKQYIKTVTLLPDFGDSDEDWDNIDKVFNMEDEAL